VHKDLDDDSRLAELIDAALNDQTREINQTRVASLVLVTKAIREHTKALSRSAEAAEAHTRGLKWATWALFAATIALVIVGILK